MRRYDTGLELETWVLILSATGVKGLQPGTGLGLGSRAHF